ncbi:MAG: hypothetical protein ACLVJ6_11590 [Merdibacter sp.]
MSMDDLQAVEALEQRCFNQAGMRNSCAMSWKRMPFRMPWCWKKRERSWGA